MTARQKVPLTDYTEPVFAENLSSSTAPLIRDTLSVSGGDDEDPSESQSTFVVKFKVPMVIRGQSICQF